MYTFIWSKIKTTLNKSSQMYIFMFLLYFLNKSLFGMHVKPNTMRHDKILILCIYLMRLHKIYCIR